MSACSLPLSALLIPGKNKWKVKKKHTCDCTISLYGNGGSETFNELKNSSWNIFLSECLRILVTTLAIIDQWIVKPNALLLQVNC